jgi:hypothetical protein
MRTFVGLALLLLGSSLFFLLFFGGTRTGTVVEKRARNPLII